MPDLETGAAPTPADAEAHIAQLYAEHGRDVLAYALRRTPGPEDAADLVGETFLIAWRRAADIPPGAEARLWLYGVARLALANQRRGERRRARLSERLRSELSGRVPSEPAADVEPNVMCALALLTAPDREILLLAGWEELDPAQIARVLGISGVAARSRLHRARRRFKKELEAGPARCTPAGTGWELEEAR